MGHVTRMNESHSCRVGNASRTSVLSHLWVWWPLPTCGSGMSHVHDSHHMCHDAFVGCWHVSWRTHSCESDSSLLHGTELVLARRVPQTRYCKGIMGLCCSGVLQWCVRSRLTSNRTVLQWCVAVVCCSGVLQWCVAVVCCSGVLQWCMRSLMTSLEFDSGGLKGTLLYYIYVNTYINTYTYIYIYICIYIYMYIYIHINI